MFAIPTRWIDAPIRVVLVGAGGNGSEMLDGLCRIDRAARALGHPGLRIDAYDPDQVSYANTLRQRFWPGDEGCLKAELLMHRYGLFGGLEGRAYAEWFDEEALRAHASGRFDLLVTCVDQARVRHEIAVAARSADVARALDGVLWLDLGNGARSGQVVLGHLTGWRGDPARLPNVAELFPELSDHQRLDADNTPSCSADEALRQDLFVNRWVALAACDLLWQLLRRGSTTYHGMWVSDAGARVSEIPATVEAWASFGLMAETAEAA